MLENKRRLIPAVVGLGLLAGAAELMKPTNSVQTESRAQSPDNRSKKTVSHDLEKLSQSQTLERACTKYGLHDKPIGQEHHIFTDQNVELLTMTCQVDGACVATLAPDLQALSSSSDLTFVSRQPIIRGTSSLDATFNSVLALDQLHDEQDALVYAHPESDVLSSEQITNLSLAQRNFIQKLDAVLQASPFFVVEPDAQELDATMTVNENDTLFSEE